MQVYPRGKRRTKNEPEIKDVEDPKPEQGWLELELLELAVGPPNEGEGKSPEPVASDDICRPPSSFHRPSPLKKSDILPMLLITAIYGVIAFLGLGSTDTPESFASLKTVFHRQFSGLPIIRFQTLCVFTGIGTGKYQIRTSRMVKPGQTALNLSRNTPSF